MTEYIENLLVEDSVDKNNILVRCSSIFTESKHFPLTVWAHVSMRRHRESIVQLVLFLCCLQQKRGNI